MLNILQWDFNPFINTNSQEYIYIYIVYIPSTVIVITGLSGHIYKSVELIACYSCTHTHTDTRVYTHILFGGDNLESVLCVCVYVLEHTLL